MAAVNDQYTEMTGPVLAAELGRRELNVSGKVEELRDRLREDDRQRAEKAAQADADGSDDAPEGEEAAEVPSQREPADHSTVMAVVLTEDQARALTVGEASFARFLKHVTGYTSRKYVAGDSVIGLADWENNVCRVFPFGVEIKLEEEPTEDGLERLAAANDELQGD